MKTKSKAATPRKPRKAAPKNTAGKAALLAHVNGRSDGTPFGGDSRNVAYTWHGDYLLIAIDCSKPAIDAAPLSDRGNHVLAKTDRWQTASRGDGLNAGVNVTVSIDPKRQGVGGAERRGYRRSGDTAAQ